MEKKTERYGSGPAVGKKERLYARLFARVYDPVMAGAEAAFLQEKRQELLRHARGQVLEVGAGTGANLPLYPADAQVLAIEPSAAMLGYAQRLLEQEGGVKAQVQLLQAGIEDEAVAQAVPPGGYDCIVVTLVLCTIPHAEGAIGLLRQWLRPGGRLLVLEHIQAERQPWRWLQQAINPAWKCLAEGCCLNRPTDLRLKAQGFHPLEERYYLRQWVPFYWAVMGVAAAK